MALFVPTFELARALGQEVLRVDAPTVGHLFDRLATEHGDTFRRGVRGCVVVVNGRSIDVLAGRRTPLGPDDQVWLVKPAAGG